jgi:hypothetical protein
LRNPSSINLKKTKQKGVSEFSVDFSSGWTGIKMKNQRNKRKRVAVVLCWLARWRLVGGCLA